MKPLISLTRSKLPFPAVCPLAAAIVVFGFALTTASAQTPVSIQQVRPTVVQPDGLLRIGFNQPVKVGVVKVGNVDATVFSQPGAATSLVDVKIPPNAPLGQQAITVTLADNPATPATASVIVAPLIAGLKADKDAPAQLSRFAVAGGEVILQFSDSIPSEIRQKLIVKLDNTRVPYTLPQNDYLLIDVPENTAETTHTVNVSIEGSDAILERTPKLGVVYAYSIKWRAWFFLLLIIGAVYLLYKLFYKIPVGQRRYTFLKMLLLDQETQTYSLSRVQFVGWLSVIIWCYLFLYYAHGMVDQYWSFPNLGGAVYTFLISLGTLVAAQATARAVGPKGAGEVHPSLANLVVHGGVLALDRVQQLVWTAIAIVIFVRITVATFGTAQGLPEIPQQLLILMGLSSAGYLGGKMVRGAGPVISEVVARAGSVILTIRGRHFSKDAFVWLDGQKQPAESLKFTDDLDDPKYAKEIELTVATLTIDQWNKGDHAITVINDDAQRADWRPGVNVAQPSAPTDVTPRAGAGGGGAGAGNAANAQGQAGAVAAEGGQDATG